MFIGRKLEEIGVGACLPTAYCILWQYTVIQLAWVSEPSNLQYEEHIISFPLLERNPLMTIQHIGLHHYSDNASLWLGQQSFPWLDQSLHSSFVVVATWHSFRVVASTDQYFIKLNAYILTCMVFMEHFKFTKDSSPYEDISLSLGRDPIRH